MAGTGVCDPAGEELSLQESDGYLPVNEAFLDGAEYANFPSGAQADGATWLLFDGEEALTVVAEDATLLKFREGQLLCRVGVDQLPPAGRC